MSLVEQRSARGTAIDEPTGVCEGSAGPLYRAWVRDPDGNKLWALYRMPEAE